jgi:hypothetical protein
MTIMTDDRYLKTANVVLDLVDSAFPGWTPWERASLISVALGVRLGELMFPRDPRRALVHSGMILGSAALFAQQEKTKEVKLSCEGSA